MKRVSLLHLIASGAALFLGATPMLAQQPSGQVPAEVLRRTPPPGPTDGVARQGAGGVVAPDGTRLVAAQDPYAAQPAPQASAQRQPVAPVVPEPKVTAADEGQQFGVSGDGLTVMTVPTQKQPARQTDPNSAIYQAQMQQLLSQQEEGLSQLKGARAEILKMGGTTQRSSDGLDVDPEGALIQAQIDPRTGKPRRRASQIARASGLVMIPAGTMLTIRNITRAQTQLGGTILGILEFDVMSSQMDAIALPRGCKILGAIQQVGGASQDRAAFIFRQVVDPNGDQTQILVPEAATNSIGMAGVGTGDGATVNRHLGQKFGTALAWGLLGAVTGNNTNSQYNPRATFNDTLRQNVSGSFGQVGQGYLQQSLDIKSDIEVPENTSMRIILGNPIYIRAWKVLRPF